MGHQRLGRGYRCLGKRRWGEPVQRHPEQEGASEEPWQSLAQDRSLWINMAASFAAPATRKIGRAGMPIGRFMFADVQQDGDPPRH